MGFLHELKRRNVLRVAAGYALVAWIMIEAGSVLLPEFFGAPDWFFKVYVLIVFAGFVLAMIIAWVFEITPDGVKLESEVDRSTYVSPRRPVWNLTLISLLVIALGVSLSFNLSGVRRDGPAEREAMLSTASLAVLPFANTSADTENQAFADGLHIDLLSRLASVGSLHVISKTSVNEYRDTNKNPRQIATELNVGAIVEGSVQRAGNQVRINIALLDAGSGVVLWSDTYDRQVSVEDLFAIQTEVSNRIAAALQATLTAEDEFLLARVPTTSIEAFELYATGTRKLAERSYESLLEARALFERAIEIDADFAYAHAGLAKAVLLLFINVQAVTEDEAFRVADAASARALALDDSLAEAYAVRGLLLHYRWLRTRVGDEINDAADALTRAIALDASNSDAYVWLSSLRQNQGRIDEATSLLTTALSKDPLSRIPYVSLPALLAVRGRHEESLDLLVKAAQRFPDWSLPYQYLSTSLQRLGRLDEAVAWDILGARLTGDPMYGGNLLGVYIAFDRADLVVKYLASIPPGHPAEQIAKGIIELESGGGEEAMQHLIELRTESSPLFLGQFIARRLVMEGRFEEARNVLLETVPTLALDKERLVDRLNLADAVVYAYVLQQLGDPDRARELLTEARTVAADMPRLGYAGHGIVDVLALALLGQKDFALDSLRAAIDDGFVSLLVFDVWDIDDMPLLDGLRDDARYIGMRAEIAQRLEAARQNVIEAHDSANWLPLLEPVDPTIGERIEAPHPPG